MFCILSEKAHLRIFLPLCTFLKGSGVVFPTMAGRILPHPLPPPPPCSPVPSPRWPGHGWPGPGWPGLAWAGPATWLAGWRVRSLCVSAQPHVLLSPSLAVPSPSLSSSLTLLWLSWLPPSALLLLGCGGRRCCRWQGHRRRSCCRCHRCYRCRCCLCCPYGFVSLRCVSVAVRRCRYHCCRPSALALSGCCRCRCCRWCC